MAMCRGSDRNHLERAVRGCAHDLIVAPSSGFLVPLSAFRPADCSLYMLVSACKVTEQVLSPLKSHASPPPPGTESSFWCDTVWSLAAAGFSTIYIDPYGAMRSHQKPLSPEESALFTPSVPNCSEAV